MLLPCQEICHHLPPCPPHMQCNANMDEFNVCTFPYSLQTLQHNFNNEKWEENMEEILIFVSKSRHVSNFGDDVATKEL
jgi:hypothetical protein